MKKIDEIYEEKNDIWGFPQIYKNVSFFPIKLKDVRAMNLFYRIFQYPKSYLNDIDVVKSTYLKFLMYFVQHSINQDGNEISQGILEFFSLITGLETEFLYEVLDVPGSMLDKLVISLKIGNTIFTEKDFEILREIVLLQNGTSLEYVESYNPELEKRINFLNRKFDGLTLEDEIWAFCGMMRKTIYEIQDYTLYQFKKSFERMILLTNFELYSPLEVSGQISSKDGKSEIIKHYLSHVGKEGRYDSILIKQENYVEQNADLFNPDFMNK